MDEQEETFLEDNVYTSPQFRFDQSKAETDLQVQYEGDNDPLTRSIVGRKKSMLAYRKKLVPHEPPSEWQHQKKCVTRKTIFTTRVTEADEEVRQIVDPKRIKLEQLRERRTRDWNLQS